MKKSMVLQHKKQPASWECGYYTMLYMEKIILLHGGVDVRWVSKCNLMSTKFLFFAKSEIRLSTGFNFPVFHVTSMCCSCFSLFCSLGFFWRLYSIPNGDHWGLPWHLLLLHTWPHSTSLWRIAWSGKSEEDLLRAPRPVQCYYHLMQVFLIFSASNWYFCVHVPCFGHVYSS